MQPALLDLVEAFRAAQDRAVAFIVGTLRDVFGVRLPSSRYGWLVHCGEAALCWVNRVNGVGGYTHGAGIELTFPDLAIDFDFGEEGEPDGFDVWRLHPFTCLDPKFVLFAACAEMRGWLEDAEAAGELTRDLHLHYSPRHRASRIPHPQGRPDEQSLKPLPDHFRPA